MKDFKLTKKDNLNGERGFTLVETLVAIFILLISITGPLTVAQNGLRAAMVSRDQTTAFYLAQDAMETVKNIRDDNILSRAGDWLEGLDYCLELDGCTIDTTSNDVEIVSCSIPSVTNGCTTERPLLYEESSGQFGIGNGGDPALFSRLIEIEESAEDREATITVTIRWTTHENVGEREIVVQENIFNWGQIINSP
jgi:prepilin-type N-terminal cleavage/methylation domain-containing protein